MDNLITTLPPSFAATAAAAPASSGGVIGDILSDGLSNFSFHDFLSVINPLQHLPVVSTIYRAVTGDSIKPLERIAGDSLYGGLWGFVSSVANVAFQEITGKDFGDTAIALLEGKDNIFTSPTDVADNGASSSPDTDATTAAPGMASATTAQLADLAGTGITPSVQALSGVQISPATTAGIASADAVANGGGFNGAASSAVAAGVGVPAFANAVTATSTNTLGAPRVLPAPISPATGDANATVANARAADSALTRRAVAAYRKSLETAAVPIF